MIEKKDEGELSEKELSRATDSLTSIQWSGGGGAGKV
jgi:hypothetical protein